MTDTTARTTEEAPGNSPGALPSDLRDLLTAISETLALPDPGSNRVDLVRYESCASERMHLVQLVIRSALNSEDTSLGWEAAYLRERNTARPLRYRTSEEELADLRRITDATSDIPTEGSEVR